MAKIKHTPTDYAAARRAAYPPVSELADALVHQSMGNKAPLDLYLSKCALVKKSIPKPAGAPATPQAPSSGVQLTLNLGK